MKQNLKSIFLPIMVIGLLGTSSFIANAQTVISDVSGLESQINSFTNVLSAITNLLLVLAVVYFFFRLGLFVLGKVDEKAKLTNELIKSVVVLAVMVSLWGLIALLQGVLGVESDADAPEFSIPTVERSGSRTGGNSGE